MELPKDFNWKIYLDLNDDLEKKKLDREKSERHYLKYGIKENRKYKYELPKDFDWKRYVELNNDLKKKDFDEQKANNHYLKYGIFEKRKYKIMNHNDLFYLNSGNFNVENHFSTDKISIITDENHLFDCLHSDLLLVTKLNKNQENKKFLEFKHNIDILNILNDFILIIDFPNGGGGTTFFLNCIVSKYKKYQTFIIARNIYGLLHLNINEDYEIFEKYNENESISFLDNFQHKISKIFVNHTLTHSKGFIQKLFTMNKEITTITHDYYNLIKNSQPLHNEIEQELANNLQDFDINQYHLLITQNTENVSIFKRKYQNQMVVVELPDYRKSDKFVKIEDSNNIIVVGVIGNIIDIKGREILESIIHYFRKNVNIRIIVIGKVKITNFNDFYIYNSIDEFNTILMEQKPNILLELSLWPETYSYTLTLSMLTQLPILCLKKKFNSVIHNRLKNYSKTHFFSGINELEQLINFHKQYYLYTIQPIIYYNKFWNDYFITKKDKITIENPRFKYNVKPYFIYFPQFHKIIENDTFFYDGYSDMKNVILYNKNNEIKVDEPLKEYFDIKTNHDYDLKNEKIIQKQVDLIKDYGFEGLAIYYYWFSINTLSKKNIIMDEVINTFFQDKINMYEKKIFFIWANENWTDNKAFGETMNYKIQNEYFYENFYNNAKNLINYFKHENYLKIDNKPVFLIYHTYLLTENQINDFYNILSELCIKNGFDGIHFVLNSLEKIYENKPNFYINFNYKKYNSRFYDKKNSQNILDYKKYLSNQYHIKDNVVQTIVFDFNNRPRLFQPDRLKNSTICINNSEMNKYIFTNKLIQTYNREKNNDVENILLVNSLNEWGENMSFEPSNKYGFYNLNILFNMLTK
jgi:hypothetical protein